MIPSEPILSEQPIQPEPQFQSYPQPNNQNKSLKLIIGLLSVLLILILGGMGYLYSQLHSVKQDKTQISQTPTTSPQATVQTKTDNTVPSDWKTYTNTVHNISFAYPPDWILDNDNEINEIKVEIKLVKDKSVIYMYLALDGIGGIGKDIDGTEYTLDNLKLFQYEDDHPNTGNHVIGLTDSLTKTLGVFKYNEKTYSITLSYPLNITENQADMYKNDFNKILSTFRFTNNETDISEDIIDFDGDGIFKGNIKEGVPIMI